MSFSGTHTPPGLQAAAAAAAAAYPETRAAAVLGSAETRQQLDRA
jgi:hypothetical protein